VHQEECRPGAQLLESDTGIVDQDASEHRRNPTEADPGALCLHTRAVDVEVLPGTGGGAVTQLPGVVLIESESALHAFVTRARAEAVVAVDTEAASFHRYVDRVYLVQVSIREATAVIDPLAVTNLDPLGDIIGDPDIEVVFHDADYDLRILDRDYGFRASHLFDTRIAAQLLGEPSVGLASLLERHLAVQLTKRYQRADWSQRPLPAEMIDYAASDTGHLIPLRDFLRASLERRGRLAWALEEFERAAAVRWSPTQAKPDPHLRIKGAKQLGAREQLALHRLVEWREAEARRRDRPPFRIVGNDALVAAARRLPRTDRDLHDIPDLPPALRDRHGAGLLRAVAQALEVPDRDVPRPRNVARQAPNADHLARLERLKLARNDVAKLLELDPGVLCGKPLLEVIAQANPGSRDELKRIPELRRWQLEVLGPAFLAALER